MLLNNNSSGEVTLFKADELDRIPGIEEVVLISSRDIDFKRTIKSLSQARAKDSITR